MLANREGLFHAYPVEIGLGETPANKLLQVVINYRLFEELASGQWVDCSAENMDITGYHILEKRDHSLNEMTIQALKAALGWDGRDPFWLQDNATQLVQQPVQVKLGFEEYNGSTTLKVQFLNPYGSRGGGVPKGDDEMRRSVGNRLGAKFRANAGGTSAPAPKPTGTPVAGTTQRPVLSKPATSSPPAATAPTPPPSTMEQAWEEFVKHCPPEKWDQQAIEKEWFRIIAELFPGKQPEQLTHANWGIMLAEGPGKIIPF
jgi:hypothetical protein